MWKIKYENDVDSSDKRFWEWWTITDGEKSFESKDENNAKWLCELLNNQKRENIS